MSTEAGGEQWTPVIPGAAALVYSLMTNYELGVVGIISMPMHLMLDIGSGIILAVSPWLFGFAGNIWWPHVVFGFFEIGAGLMTKTVPDRGDDVRSAMTV